MPTIFGPRTSSLFETSVPLVVGLFCVMLTMLPWGWSTTFFGTPAFALMAVFYWGLYRPDLMPPFSVFVIGLYHDLASAGPLGLWALIYLFVYAVVLSQRLFFIGRPFFAIWVAFGLTAVIAGLIAWVITGLYYGAVLSPLPAFGQALVSFIVYPLVGRPFGAIQRRFTSYH